MCTLTHTPRYYFLLQVIHSFRVNAGQEQTPGACLRWAATIARHGHIPMQVRLGLHIWEGVIWSMT